MREIHLNGYIDDAEWFGDEITPESLHEMLYPPGEGAQDDLRIIGRDVCNHRNDIGQ